MDVELYAKRLQELVYPEPLKRPRIISTGPTVEQTNNYLLLLNKYEAALPGHRAAKEKYRVEEAAILQEFKEALFEDLGIKDNPKAEKLYWIAWEKGHTSGLSEVYSEACDMVDLIK